MWTLIQNQESGMKNRDIFIKNGYHTALNANERFIAKSIKYNKNVKNEHKCLLLYAYLSCCQPDFFKCALMVFFPSLTECESDHIDDGEVVDVLDGIMTIKPTADISSVNKNTLLSFGKQMLTNPDSVFISKGFIHQVFRNYQGVGASRKPLHTGAFRDPPTKVKQHRD